ncbi:MAG TPA: DUF2273 domain-containing protein [Clostridiaceae bacterium]|nr:DUF2273 domain-containing protein [Clostridiaceae bacterium]
MFKERLLSFYHTYRGGIDGAFIGLIVATAVLLLGVYRVVFIAICMSLGYFIGTKMSENKDYLKNLLDRILPPGTYR